LNTYKQKIYKYLLIIGSFLFFSFNGVGPALAGNHQNALLKVSVVNFRLVPLVPEVKNQHLTAKAELYVEINTTTDWTLQWDVHSKGDGITCLLDHELSGHGPHHQTIPIIWDFDWTMPPGDYELPVTVTLLTPGQARVGRTEALNLAVPFLAKITPQTINRLRITDDHPQAGRITLQIQANAPWLLQVELTKSEHGLALLCESLHKTASINFLSSSPVQLGPNQPVVLAQGEAGGEHSLTLDWQKASMLALRAGEYDLLLKFSLLPVRGKAF